MYKLYSTVALTVVALSVHAQGRRMAIVDMPVSAVSLAHGGGVFGFSERALVYADPSVGFDDTQTTMCANYAFGLVDGAGGSMGLHTLGLSHRSGKHLLMGGAFCSGQDRPGARYQHETRSRRYAIVFVWCGCGLCPCDGTLRHLWHFGHDI